MRPPRDGLQVVEQRLRYLLVLLESQLQLLQTDLRPLYLVVVDFVTKPRGVVHPDDVFADESEVLCFLTGETMAAHPQQEEAPGGGQLPSGAFHDRSTKN